MAIQKLRSQQESPQKEWQFCLRNHYITRRWKMANFWCVDSETSGSGVIMKIPISGVVLYGWSHRDIKHTIKKSFVNRYDVNLTMLQILLMAIGAGLPSPATFLFNRSIRPLLLHINRESINFNANDENNKGLKAWWDECLKVNYTHIRRMEDHGWIEWP